MTRYYICSKLREQKVLSEDDCALIQQAMLKQSYVSARHRKQLIVYFNCIPLILKTLETQCFDWHSLRPFVESVLEQIRSNEMDSVFKTWMQTMFTLNEIAAHPITDIDMLDLKLELV